MAVVRVRLKKQTVTIQFFEDLDREGDVTGYWKTATNYHPELKGIPELKVHVPNVPVGTILKLQGRRLRRFC